MSATYYFLLDYVKIGIEKESKSNSIVAKNIINDLQIKAKQIAILVSNIGAVQQSYKFVNEEDGAAYLKQKINPLINNLQKAAGVDRIEIHFHKPGARSFLRVWTNKRGDNLSKFRQTILEVERTQKPISAIELGVGGFAIRGLSPIFDENNKYIGSCEMFYNPDDVINFLALEKSTSDAFYLVNNDKAKELFSQDIISKNYPNEINGLLVSKNSNPKINIKQILNKGFFDNLSSKNEVYQEGDYSLTSLPMQDYSGNIVGYMVLAYDISTSLNSMYKNLLIIFSIIFITFTIVNLNFLAFFIKFIIKPIKQVTDIANNVARGNLDNF